MALPTPVLSDGNIGEIEDFYTIESAKLFWNNWKQDPIKAAVFQAMLSRLSGRHYSYDYRRAFSRVFSTGLGQNRVCPLHCSLLRGDEVHYLNAFRISRKLVTAFLPFWKILAFGRTISMPNNLAMPIQQ